METRRVLARRALKGEHTGPGVAQCKACYGDKVCLNKACIEMRANRPRRAPVHGVLWRLGVS